MTFSLFKLNFLLLLFLISFGIANNKFVIEKKGENINEGKCDQRTIDTMSILDILEPDDDSYYKDYEDFYNYNDTADFICADLPDPSTDKNYDLHKSNLIKRLIDIIEETVLSPSEFYDL